MLDILMNLQSGPHQIRNRGREPRPEAAWLPEHVLPEYLTQVGVPFRIEEQDTYSVVKKVVPEGRPPARCARVCAVAFLYRVATELGCTKIALGHHRDDILQTMFMNMFFGSTSRACRPNWSPTTANTWSFAPWPIAVSKTWPSSPSTASSPSFLATRAVARKACSASKCANDQRVGPQVPRPVDNMFTALSNIIPSHMMDRKLYPFETIQATGAP